MADYQKFSKFHWHFLCIHREDRNLNKEEFNMARIKYIEEGEVKDPKVKDAYERMRIKRGKVTNIYKPK